MKATTDIRPCPGCGSAESRTYLTESSFVIVKCVHCSLVFLGNPPDERDLYEDYYQSREPEAGDYSFDSPNPGQRELFAINRQRIRRIQQLKPAGSLLDIGCGRGQFVKSAQDAGYSAYGIDVSERAVALAKREFQVQAEVTGLSEMLASGRQFDIVTLWHVLEHFNEPLQALKHVNALLRDDGLCIIEVPNLHSLKFILSKSKWEGGNHPLYHRSFFSAATLRRMLIESGFDRSNRMHWSYHLPNRSLLYELPKRLLDVAAMDSFLDVIAWKYRK